MKRALKSISLAIAILIGVSFTIPTGVFAEKQEKVFNLIEITDFHGALEDSKGLPVAAVLAENIIGIKAANPDRILILGGGDLYQGSPVSNILRGVPVQKILDSMGMEVTALGNHEFDWSIDTLKSVTMKNAKYSVVCANLYDRTTGKRTFEPYRIYEKDGIKIAVIGATTLDTPNIVLAANVENYEFTDIAKEINNAAQEIRSGKKADIVLAVVHEGGAVNDKGEKSGPIFDIASKLTGVDALFGGHTHTIVNTVVGNMPVLVANNAGKGFVNLKMTVDDSKKPVFKGEYTALDTDVPNGYKAAALKLNKDVKGIVDEAKVQIGPILDEKLGVTDTDLTRNQGSAPYGDSFLGNWITDVIRDRVKADIALQNNGGIRIDIPKGDITTGTMYYIMPFDNTICTLHIKKAGLKALLEQAFNDADPANRIIEGKGIQLSGIKVTYDSSRPSFDRILDIMREDGSLITEDEELLLATNDFLAGGGDGFTQFKKYKYADSGILVRDAMSDNIKANNGIYTKLNGRIINSYSPKGQEVITTHEGKSYYTVKAGDCLSAIGELFGTDYMIIARENNINNVDLIFPGQKLLIPSR